MVARGHQSTDPRVARRRERTGLRFPRWTQKRQLQGGHPNPLTRPPGDGAAANTARVCADEGLGGTREGRSPSSSSPYRCWDQLSVVSWQVAPNPGNRGAKSTEFVWGKGAPTRSPNKLPTQATRELCAPTNLGPPRAQTQQNRPHMALQRSAHPPTWPTTSPGTLGRARQAGTVAGKPVRTHAPGGGGV